MILNKSKIILVLVMIAASSVMAAWELVSQYDMDGDYTAAPPGSGTALLDSGPAGHHLYTIDLGDIFEENQPEIVAGGSNGSPNAFSFDADTLDTLNAAWNINIVKGFKIELSFKDSGQQVNPYPNMLSFFVGTSRVARVEARPQVGATPGPVSSIYFYIGETGCVLNGSWNDGQWHNMVIEYNPADAVMKLDVDGVVSTASYTSVIPVTPDYFRIGHCYTTDTGSQRGYDGLIDNVKVYKRTITYLPYTSYHFNGTFDRETVSGTALSDEGPMTDNPLAKYAAAAPENTPVQIDDGFTEQAFAFDGIVPQILAANFNLDIGSGFVAMVRFKTDTVPSPVQAYPYLLRIEGSPTMAVQGEYRADPNRFDQVSFNFNNVAITPITAPSGTGWNDNQWHTVKFGYEKGTVNGWTFVNIDNIDSYRMNSGFVASNSTLLTVGGSSSLNSRYGFSGAIDDIEFYYAALATQVLSPAAGDVIYWDQDYLIKWDADIHLSGCAVAIEYSTDNAATWTAITASTENTGSYLWKAPQLTPSGQCLIRVKNTTIDIIYAVSGNFSLLENCPLESDISGDCRIDMNDFAIISYEWLD